MKTALAILFGLLLVALLVGGILQMLAEDLPHGKPWEPDPEEEDPDR